MSNVGIGESHANLLRRRGLRRVAKLDEVIPQTFGYVLRRYLRNPESKSLAHNGTAWVAETRGLLKRASLVAGEMHYMGKELIGGGSKDEDVSLLEFTPMEFRPSSMVVADSVLR